MRHLLIVLLFISCNTFSGPDQKSEEPFIPEMSIEKLDTVKNSSYLVSARPFIFETAFFSGTQAKMDTFPIKFYSVDIGKISIECGKIIACDPIVMHSASPFSQDFPIGQFPVHLAIAKINDDERVAFSRVLFSANPVAKWEFALQDGQKQLSMESDSIYGYGVDAGLGLFIDKKANDAFNNLYSKNNKIWDDVFINDINKHSRNTWGYTLYNFEGYNLASFSTGFGDGTYGTYVGYDENGNICRLLTDFGLVDWLTK